MANELRRAVLFTVVSMALVGAYHVVLWGIGRTVFPEQAAGSLLRRADGTVVGSALIAQKFTTAAYFQPRPSAVDYNAASTGGSNYGPSSPDHLKAVRERLDATLKQERLDATVKQEQVQPADVPSEMVTTSGAGLDPHIPPAGALLQVRPRGGRARCASRSGESARRIRDRAAATRVSGPAAGQRLETQPGDRRSIRRAGASVALRQAGNRTRTWQTAHTAPPSGTRPSSDRRSGTRFASSIRGSRSRTR